MAFPKIQDVRKLNDEELSEEILSAKRKLFELRLQQATRQLEKPHQFKHLRHRIAQMLTVERERQIEAKLKARAAAESEPATPAESEPATPAESKAATPVEEAATPAESEPAATVTATAEEE